MTTFTTTDIHALAHRAALRGDRAMAGLLRTFADRPGLGTDHIVRTVTADDPSSPPSATLDTIAAQITGLTRVLSRTTRRATR